jgi:xylulokinase
MEGVTLGLGYGLARFRGLGIEPAEIRLTGGGSHSAAWRRICADVFGVPVVCMESGAGAGLGAALQAAWVFARTHGSDAQLHDVTEALVRTDASTRAEPDAAAVALYAGLLDRTNQLRTTLAGAGFL